METLDKLEVNIDSLRAGCIQGPVHVLGDMDVAPELGTAVRFLGDVRVEGSVRVGRGTDLIIAGDLIVRGSLEARSLDVFGRVSVTGDRKVSGILIERQYPKQEDIVVDMTINTDGTTSVASDDQLNWFGVGIWS